MNASMFLALGPILILSGTAMVLMIQASIRRDHKIASLISAIGLVLSLLGVYYAKDYAQPVTALLQVDQWSLFFTGLVIGASLITLVLSLKTFSPEGERKEEYYLLLILSLLGAVVLIQSSHMVALLLGMELMGVALYAMIAFPEKGDLPLEGAIKYLVLSACASAMLLYGFALIYAATGSLSYIGIGIEAAGAYEKNPILLLAGSAMVLAGIGFKLSVAPFHMWTPDVYEGAPTPVTGFLATVSKGAVFVAFARLYFDGNLHQYSGLNNALAVIAIASMLIGNWLALRQENIKRLLAYSSIAHFGYLFVALIAGSLIEVQIAMQSITFYLAAYIVTTLAAFAVVSSFAGEVTSRQEIKSLEGLFWYRPLEASALSIAMLSLAGIPLTAGFMAKFFVINAGIQANLWILLASLIVGSAIAIYYYLRVIFAMSKSSEVEHQTATTVDRAVAIIMIASVLLLGSWPQPFIAYVGTL